ncbi:DUF1127 domain-containing protein [Falsiroseomonas sp. E2-1-a20]|uniref:DUF1127 domain-containing protein n=1 Tax=Falsiroseomonas sp. E2-1-a20 TaxID=3239300 RepID=UPI003F357C18
MPTLFRACPIRRPRMWERLLDWLAGCAHRHRTRAALRDLCPHLLRDLGLTEGEALREARRAPWQR